MKININGLIKMEKFFESRYNNVRNRMLFYVILAVYPFSARAEIKLSIIKNP